MIQSRSWLKDFFIILAKESACQNSAISIGPVLRSRLFFSLFSYSVSWQGRRGPFPWLEDCECKRARPPRCHYCVMLVNRSLCAGIMKLFLLVTSFFLLKNRNCTYFVFLICIDNWCCWLRQCPKGTVCRKRYQRVSLCSKMTF